MKKFFEEFKAFAMRGNVLDMAVGVVIGSAFTAIVNSLVKDIITPIMSLLTSGVDLSSLSIPLGEGEEAAAIAYGNFIQSIISFIIIAFAVFVMVKTINKLSNLRKKEEEEAAHAPEEPKGPTSEELLTEIRDLLKEKN
ncbi:MAG: large-conductance mechanosensitive channel protein MscL [Oscillospiraceae bacterium]|nr:large-conductance mechanosensitive channel protein MscL [Oscillospiraceae bacterium]